MKMRINQSFWNDEMASGVMKLIIDSGYEVPKNFSIAGFDDTPSERC